MNGGGGRRAVRGEQRRQYREFIERGCSFLAGPLIGQRVGELDAEVDAHRVRRDRTVRDESCEMRPQAPEELGRLRRREIRPRPKDRDAVTARDGGEDGDKKMRDRSREWPDVGRGGFSNGPARRMTGGIDQRKHRATPANAASHGQRLQRVLRLERKRWGRIGASTISCWLLAPVAEALVRVEGGAT